MSPAKLFNEHPASVGESYWQHMAVALRFAFELFCAAVAALAHALFPFLFITTASRKIEQLHERMVTKRRQRQTAETARLV